MLVSGGTSAKSPPQTSVVGYRPIIEHYYWESTQRMHIYIYMSNGLNLLHLRKDMAEMVIVFLCVPHRSWGFNVCNKIRQTMANMCFKSHVFLCHPYRSWEFHDSIKYQCPGVTVSKCRRFWRALICKSTVIFSDVLYLKNIKPGIYFMVKTFIWE